MAVLTLSYAKQVVGRALWSFLAPSQVVKYVFLGKSPRSATKVGF